MITDGVREPSGNKRHRGAGRPWHLPSLPATPSKRCRGADSPSSLGIPPIPPPPTPNLAWPGQRRTVREHDTRGNDGGFAPLGASCRRVAPLMVQFPPAMSGHEGRRAQTAGLAAAPRAPTPPPPRHNGGFCTIRSILSACRRRVAPLLLQFPPFAGSEIAVRGGEVAVRGGVRAHIAGHRGDKRRQWGVVGEAVCIVDTTTPDRARRSHTNPLSRALTSYLARKPAIPCLGGLPTLALAG